MTVAAAPVFGSRLVAWGGKTSTVRANVPLEGRQEKRGFVDAPLLVHISPACTRSTFRSHLIQ